MRKARVAGLLGLLGMFLFYKLVFDSSAARIRTALSWANLRPLPAGAEVIEVKHEGNSVIGPDCWYLVRFRAPAEQVADWLPARGPKLSLPIGAGGEEGPPYHGTLDVAPGGQDVTIWVALGRR